MLLLIDGEQSINGVCLQRRNALRESQDSFVYEYRVEGFSLEGTLLQAFLNSWDRNCRIVVSLLNHLPTGGLEVRATESSPTVSQIFMHIHHERMISVSEEAPEFAGAVPEQEWMFEADAVRIEQLLNQSAGIVRQAVQSRIEQGRDLDLNYGHPIHLVQLLIFHEAYHYGQIKLALKIAGTPLHDDIAGPISWDILRARD